jgi:hypothetical protein
MIDTKALYIEPIHGYVQTGEDWIVDSADWYGDIPSQLASLIEVQLIDGDWVEV